MDQPHITTPSCRHDGWTPERTALFHEYLAVRGNVRAACARVGMSRDTAYRLRRRDGMFARGWDAALLLARDSVAETLGDRAIDDIEEDVWHRGELMGTRRRYDNRLLLAHMARLDKLAEQQAGFGDAERFDEILGCIAGEPVPAEFDCETGELPPDRHEHVAEAAAAAEQRVNAKWAASTDDDGELDDEAYARFEAERDSEVERARLEAAARWDEWKARACAAADALLGADISSRTVSELSASTREEGAIAAPAAAGPFSSTQTARRTG
jgi:hypothetical protein